MRGNKMEYSGTSEEGHRIASKVAIGWLGNDRIHDVLWKCMLENIAEFYCIEAYIHGFKHQFYADSPGDLCHMAKEEGCSHVLILKIGILPTQLLDKFTDWFENEYNGEVFTGHVLDKGDLYYEIHPQCMLVDVNWFCENLTAFQQRFRNKEIDFIEPIRSEENFHDEYTPHWVKQGTETRTYKGTCWGWNIVSEGLKTETGIGIWPMKIRDTYQYAYGEVAQDYHGKKANIIGYLQNKETFYIANTEDFTLPDTIPEKDPDIKRIILCTGGGLMAPFLAYNNFGNNIDNQKIVVMDRAQISLGMSDMIFGQFDPEKETYFDFMQNYFAKYQWMKRLVQGAHRLKGMSEYVDYHDAFKSYYNTTFKKLNRDFELIDLFDFNSFKRILIRHAVKPASEDPHSQYEVFINFSNVFHFYQSSVFFNMKEREKIKSDIEKFLTDLDNKMPHVNFNIIGPGGVFRFSHYIPYSMEGAAVAKEIFPWT